MIIDRLFYTFPVNNTAAFRHQMLHWSSGFDVSCLLDSNHYPDPYGRFDVLLAAGAERVLQAAAGNAWQQLRRFRGSCSDWIAGHCSYDLKEETFGLPSRHPPGGFPDMFFFQPKILLLLRGQELQVGLLETASFRSGAARAQTILDEISRCPVQPASAGAAGVDWQSPMSAEQYLDAVGALQHHLHRGDAYEINFCREFFARPANIHPAALFHRLNRLSPAPFAAFYRVGDHYLLCSSPERFLQKEKNDLISQPIKGTSPRGRNVEEDQKRVAELKASAKERSENVIAVDLVRNDLSQTALPGTVQVKELSGIYSFPQVHQMITTIAARVDEAVASEEILSRAFPMGSMTGAPKHRVLQLIDRYECSRRGIYSGTVGYFTPEGDFDFNVVIRSLVYHADRKYLSFQTGSGITVYSDPRAELEECRLKAMAMQQAVAGN